MAIHGAGAQVCDFKCDRLWIWFPFKEMEYLFKFIFSFLRSSVETKRGAYFRRLTRNASRICLKKGNAV